jgi:hypothetical protein
MRRGSRYMYSPFDVGRDVANSLVLDAGGGVSAPWRNRVVEAPGVSPRSSPAADLEAPVI